MKKIILAIVMVLVLCSYCIGLSLAEQTVTVTADTANIRKEGNTDSAIVGRARKGDVFLFVEATRSGWYKITLPDGKTGFISSTLVSEPTEAEAPPEAETEKIGLVLPAAEFETLVQKYDALLWGENRNLSGQSTYKDNKGKVTLEVSYPAVDTEYLLGSMVGNAKEGMEIPRVFDEVAEVLTGILQTAEEVGAASRSLIGSSNTRIVYNPTKESEYNEEGGFACAVGAEDTWIISDDNMGIMIPFFFGSKKDNRILDDVVYVLILKGGEKTSEYWLTCDQETAKDFVSRLKLEPDTGIARSLILWLNRQDTPSPKTSSSESVGVVLPTDEFAELAEKYIDVFYQVGTGLTAETVFRDEDNKELFMANYPQVYPENMLGNIVFCNYFGQEMPDVAGMVDIIGGMIYHCQYIRMNSAEEDGRFVFNLEKDEQYKQEEGGWSWAMGEENTWITSDDNMGVMVPFFLYSKANTSKILDDAVYIALIKCGEEYSMYWLCSDQGTAKDYVSRLKLYMGDYTEWGLAEWLKRQ